jgi:hypothetical protein
MNRKWFGIVILVAAAAALFNLSSCAHNQELVSIEVQPGTQTFGLSTTPVIDDTGLNVQLQALGSYIHPPVVKDITNEVTWFNNSPQMFTLSSSQPGLLTVTGNECGGALISATVNTNTSVGGISSSGAVITGYMNANVTCYTGSGGGSGNPVLLIQFANANSGSVTSSPAGLGTCNSPGPCDTQNFLSGTTVTLTATPSGSSTTAIWAQCPSSSGNVCTVDLTGDTIVIVDFS